MVVPVLPGEVDSLGVEGLIDGRASPGAVPDTLEDLELDAPELLMSLDLELVAPDDPELEGLLVPILPQAARAKTHAKGMIQFFMKYSLKERKETAYHFSTAVKCVTGALNRKNL
jgi:hypothetical protein